MGRALSLARAGEHARAQMEAHELAAAFPRDVNLLHQAGLVLQMSGAFDDALRLFHAALELAPDFHYTEMEVANTLLAMNQPEDGAWWFLKAARSAPDYTVAHRRAGETLHALGRHAEALQALQQAWACDPGDPDVASSLADVFVALARLDDASEVFAQVMSTGRARPADRWRYLTLLTERGQYAKVVQIAAESAENTRSSYGYETTVLAGHAALAAAQDRPALVAAARDRQGSARWLGAADVVSRLRAAIAQRTPLSLIRMGDDEARFLAHRDPCLRGRLTDTQIQVLGEVPFRHWFGQPIAAADQRDVAWLYAAAAAALAEADILGVASAERLATDNLHVGYLGHLEGLLARAIPADSATRFTDVSIHLELHRRSPYYRDILSGLDFLGVISPHPGLARRLAGLHGIGQFAEYLIPGRAHRTGDQRLAYDAPHFLGHHNEICDRIAAVRPGAVFIVDGGLLAKVYCTWIKQRGGIAIDAGSIVDGWMGSSVRSVVSDEAPDWIFPQDRTGPV